MATALMLPGLTASAEPANTVSRITFVETPDGIFKNDGCEGSDSVVGFTFASSGSGTVTIRAVSEAGQEVAITQLEVTSPETTVSLPIRGGFVGTATISIEAANYKVALGQKGDQTKYDERSTSIGSALCSYDAMPDPDTQSAHSPWAKPLVVSGIIAGLIMLAVALIALCYSSFRRPS